MLRFQAPPTPAASHMVAVALSHHRDDLLCMEDEDWNEREERVTRCFTRPLAVQTTDGLIDAHESVHLFQLTDYHWLLLYDALDLAFALANDEGFEGYLEELPLATPDDSVWLTYHTSGRPQFDLGAFLDIFFWDVDFLFEPELVDALGADGRQLARMNEELWGLARGLAPHSKELELVRVPSTDLD